MLHKIGCRSFLSLGGFWARVALYGPQRVLGSFFLTLGCSETQYWSNITCFELTCLSKWACIRRFVLLRGFNHLKKLDSLMSHHFTPNTIPLKSKKVYQFSMLHGLCASPFFAPKDTGYHSAFSPESSGPVMS